MHLPTLKDVTTLKDVNKESNICKAYMFFRDFLEKRKQEGINLLQLLNTVTARVTFVTISLRREDDEQQIFDTINSLGEPLSTGDLIKNFLYKPEDEDAYKNNWKPVFDDLSVKDFWNSSFSKSRQSKKKEDKTIERFFHAFVRIKMWDFKDNDGFNKDEFVKIGNVFRTCKSFVEFNVDRQELANEIIEYAKLFKDHLNPEDLNNRLPQYAGIKRISCIINATKNYAPTPYVLYVLRNVKDEGERNKIFGYLESYLIRRIIVGKKTNSDSELFGESLINKKAVTYNDFKKYIDGRVNSQTSMPSRNDLKFAYANKTLKDSSASLILYMYETKLSKPSDPNTIIGGLNDYYAVQLMPKDPKSHKWPIQNSKDKEEARKQLAESLGNYFLIEADGGKKTMKKHVDSSCDIKTGVMLKWSTNIRSNQRLIDVQTKQPISKWEEKDIKERNTLYMDIFDKEIWPA